MERLGDLLAEALEFHWASLEELSSLTLSLR